MSNPRFSIIPAGAVTDRTLEPRDLQVLCLLGRHTDKVGWCTRSQVKMAQEIDCSRASLQNSLERLYAAGWVQKKRRDLEVEASGGQPSRSYAYRVLLDRDDYALEATVQNMESDEGESYAENANEEGGCQPVGTGVPTPGDGTGATPYDGTKNVPLERPLSERERDARARERTAKFLAAFEPRWPTSAGDSRQRVAYAAGSLTEDEQEAALLGIGPFLENLKRIGRKHVPAGWTYLEEKRWTLLEAKAKAGIATQTLWPGDGAEAKAIIALHELAGRMAAVRSYMRQPDGSISFVKAVTPQLIALAQAPPQSEWLPLNRAQAAAWEEFLRHFFDAAVMRRHLKEGDLAPWPWPPSVEGKIYTADTGPPQTADQDDMADFK